MTIVIEETTWHSAIETLANRDILLIICSYDKQIRDEEWELILDGLERGNTQRAVVRQPQFQFKRDEVKGVPLFDSMCTRGHLEPARWLCDTFVITYRECSQDLFQRVCSVGLLHVATWLYATFPRAIDNLRLGTVNGFGRACGRGYLPVAKWLHTTFQLISTDLTRFGDCHHVFVHTCTHGQLAVAEWLSATYRLPLSVLESGFLIACKRGHLSTAAWLHATLPRIRIHVLRAAFRETRNTKTRWWLHRIINPKPAAADVVASAPALVMQ